MKVFEPTTNLKVSLFLAADRFQPNDSRSVEDFELAVSVAASIAYYLVEQGTPVGLVSNACLAESDLTVRIPPGGSRDQLMDILEALAKVTLRAKGSLEIILQKESKSLRSGTTLVLIAPKAPESLFWLLSDMKEKGHKLLLLLIGDRQKTGSDGVIPTFHIRHPGSLLEVSPGV